MNIYIRSAESISPQHTFSQPSSPEAGRLSSTEASRLAFLPAPVEYTGNRLKSIEPDYRGLLDAKLMRRMSRIIRMGVAAADACLRRAGEKEPGAIVTGTAYGCLEDTGLFLTGLIERNEEALQPGAFIQSTHNTVGAQIALMLQCTRYNNTFVHRGLSFESALLDSIMLLQEGEADNVLVGGIDENTDSSHAILSRFGLYRRSPVSNLALFGHPSRGTIAGEGAAFFLLTGRSSPDDDARLEGLTTFYKPGGIGEIEGRVRSFLTAHAIDPDTIDLLITGRNGDRRGDRIYDQLEGAVFGKSLVIPYKHLCGEYPSSTSFALWMAAQILKTGFVPSMPGVWPMTDAMPGKKIRKVLIYNHYLTIHHSLILLSV